MALPPPIGLLLPSPPLPSPVRGPADCDPKLYVDLPLKKGEALHAAEEAFSSLPSGRWRDTRPGSRGFLGRVFRHCRVRSGARRARRLFARTGGVSAQSGAPKGPGLGAGDTRSVEGSDSAGGGRRGGVAGEAHAAASAGACGSSRFEIQRGLLLGFILDHQGFTSKQNV